MPSNQDRFDYLDGIRAVAITVVVCAHWLSFFTPFWNGGAIGVDVFFVLSGFIITTMLWRAGDDALARQWWNFIKRRVMRLYPALLGLVLGSIVLYAVVPRVPLSPWQVADRGVLVLVQGSAVWAASQTEDMWLPGLHPFAPTWSLAIEWYFYLLWPIAVFICRSRGVAPMRVAVYSLGAALSLYVASLPLSTFLFYFGPSARFAELLVGAGLALWLQAVGAPVHRWQRGNAASAMALALILLYSIFGPTQETHWFKSVGVPMTVLGTVVLIYCGYSNRDGTVYRLLSSRWVSTVGRYSYSLYLWHLVPMLMITKRLMPLPLPVLGLIGVVATLVLTVVSYRWLEVPFLRPRGDVLSPAKESTLSDRAKSES